MFRFSASLAALGTLFALPFAAFAQNVPLIQPLDDSTYNLPIGSDLAFIVYFETFGSYLYILAVGFCTLWVVIGGVMIMSSGNNSSRRNEGKDLMTKAILALLLLTFGGFVLRTLNDIFFV